MPAMALTAAPDASRRWGDLLRGSGVCLAALGIAISHHLMLAGLIVAAVGALVGRRLLHRSPGFVWLLLGAVWALWATTLALLPVAGNDRWIARIDGAWYAWLILPLAAGAAGEPRWRQRIARCLVASIVIGATLALAQFLLGYDRALRPLRIDPRVGLGGRVSGCFGVHLTQAFVMGTALLVLATPRPGGDLPWPWRWCGRGMALGGLILAQARTAIVGTVLAMVAGGAVLGGRRLLMALAGGAILLGLAVGGIVLIEPQLLTAIHRHQDSRRYIWGVALEAVARRPLFGVGSREAFAEFYRHRLACDRPDLLHTLDPDNPAPMLARHSEAAAHPLLRQALANYGRFASLPSPTPAQQAHRAEFRRVIIDTFDHLTGRAGLFPRGAPHAHSSLLTLAAFYGLPSAVAYLLALLAIARVGWRRRTTDRPGAALTLGLVVFALVTGGTEYVAGDTESVYALFLTLGLALGGGRDEDATPA
jgi:O-antigen ligase